MNPEYVAENTASRLELQKLIDSLSDAELECPIGSGRTVATLLCHLAFWDQRIAHALKEWQRSGIEPSHISTKTMDSINHAITFLAQAVPGRVAAELALESAEMLDRELEQLDSTFADQVKAAGFERMLRRSVHRHAHLDQMRLAKSAA